MSLARWIICLPLLALSACHSEKSAEGAGAPRNRPPQAVEVTTPQRATMRDILTLPGTLEANESAQVRAEITGIIESIDFTDGQKVERGTALAHIDDRELQAQLAETQAQMGLARLTMERSQRLVASNSVAQAEVDAAIAEVTRLEAAQRLLEVRISKTAITAPFAGTLGARLLSPGDLIDSSQPLSTLVDVSRLKVTFPVPERFYDRLRLDGEVLVSSGRDEERVARIFFISSTIEPGTRAATVSAWLKDPPPNLRPGMFTPVRVVLETRESVLTVPEAALLASTGGDIIIAVDPAQDGESRPTARFVPVQPGLRELGRVEVTPQEPGALSDATEIVAAGVGSLVIMPGSALAPQPMQQLPARRGSTVDAPAAEDGAEAKASSAPAPEDQADAAASVSSDQPGSAEVAGPPAPAPSPGPAPAEGSPVSPVAPTEAAASPAETAVPAPPAAEDASAESASPSTEPQAPVTPQPPQPQAAR